MPAVDPFAINSYGVQVQPVEFPADPAEGGPMAKTYHGLTIVNQDEQIIGRITSWTPTAYTREAVLQYELSYKTYGRPVDQVPGRVTNFQVTGTSAEMWEAEVELRMGASTDGRVFSDLADQIRPFTVYEHWYRGQELYRTWSYQGCWLTERNEEAFAAEGETRVMANFTFQYVARHQVN